MKKWILTCLILALGFNSSYAQSDSGPSLVLCESYDESGTPSGIYYSWNINALGGYVYVIYKQPNTINAKTMSLQVDKKLSATDAYATEKTITLTPEPGKNWLMYDYYFSEEAMYKFSIIMDGITTATSETQIFVVDEDLYSADSITTFYYENSYIGFCKSVVDGQMVGESAVFKLDEYGKADISIYLSSDVPFRTDLLYIDIYKNDLLYDSYDLEVTATWDYAHVFQTFTEPGTYEVDIYNADDIYINTGVVTIE